MGCGCGGNSSSVNTANINQAVSPVIQQQYATPTAQLALIRNDCNSLVSVSTGGELYNLTAGEQRYVYNIAVSDLQAAINTCKETAGTI